MIGNMRKLMSQRALLYSGEMFAIMERAYVNARHKDTFQSRNIFYLFRDSLNVRKPPIETPVVLPFAPLILTRLLKRIHHNFAQ
jgi:hypothetical protein